jgi:ABC-type bacteriocin/lantibiotic exporter with double-glycine peptidase domain
MEHPVYQSPLRSVRFGPFGAEHHLEHHGSYLTTLREELRPFIRASVILSVTQEILTLVAALLSTLLLRPDASPQLLALVVVLTLAVTLLAGLAGVRGFTRFDSIDPLVRRLTASLVSEKLYRLSDADLARFGTAKIKNILETDALSIGQFMWSFLHSGVPAIASGVVLVPAILAFGGIATLPALAAAPLVVLLSLWSNGSHTKIEERLKSQEDGLVRALDQWILQSRLIRALGWNDALKGDVYRSARCVVREEAKKQSGLILLFGLSFTWWMVVATIYLISSRWMQEPTTAAQTFGTIWLLSALISRLQMVPGVIISAAGARVGVRRVQEFLGLEELGGQGAEQYHTLSRIVLNGVEVICEDRTILEIDELSIDCNALTVIVGAVGSGKSTLLKLLTGEIAPTRGTIHGVLVDGSIISLLDPTGRALLRSKVAYQPQEPFTAQAPLSFNVALGEASLSDIAEALRMSEFHSDLEQFGGGDLLLGEHGINLSGGQKQRVVLARALYSKRPVMILDDPFSALDRATQERIARRLIEEQIHGVLATHHPHLLPNNVRRIELHQGRIV